MTDVPGARDLAVASLRPSAASAAFQRALADLGLTCTVEGRDRLAVIAVAPGSAAALVDDATRASLVRLAARHGFTHLALELPDTGAAADDGGDAGAGGEGAGLPRA